MQPSPLDLSQNEREQLLELQEVFDLSNSRGWIARILPLMEGLVNEAHEEMLGAVYASVEIKAALLTRWQQREAMMRAVKSYIEDCKQQRSSILEEIAEREKILRNEGIPLEI